jgi:hypothetical protein
MLLFSLCEQIDIESQITFTKVPYMCELIDLAILKI